MLSNVYESCTVVAHIRVSHAHEHSVRIHQTLLPLRPLKPGHLPKQFSQTIYETNWTLHINQRFTKKHAMLHLGGKQPHLRATDVGVEQLQYLVIMTIQP